MHPHVVGIGRRNPRKALHHDIKPNAKPAAHGKKSLTGADLRTQVAAIGALLGIADQGPRQCRNAGTNNVRPRVIIGMPRHKQTTISPVTVGKHLDHALLPAACAAILLRKRPTPENSMFSSRIPAQAAFSAENIPMR